MNFAPQYPFFQPPLFSEKLFSLEGSLILGLEEGNGMNIIKISASLVVLGTILLETPASPITSAIEALIFKPVGRAVTIYSYSTGIPILIDFYLCSKIKHESAGYVGVANSKEELKRHELISSCSRRLVKL